MKLGIENTFPLNHSHFQKKTVSFLEKLHFFFKSEELEELGKISHACMNGEMIRVTDS